MPSASAESWDFYSSSIGGDYIHFAKGNVILALVLQFHQSKFRIINVQMKYCICCYNVQK